MLTDLNHVIEEAIRTALAPTKIETIKVERGQDHVDAEALFITVTLPPATPLIGGSRYLGAMVGVSDALLGMGEHQFPYVRIDHAGEEAAEDEEGGRPPASAS